MQRLTDHARSKARASIAHSFYDSDSLDGLGVLSHQLESQLVAAESQLNSAVQSKLDSLKRAVDLMDESTLKLSKLASNISRIDEKIAQTNTAISNYDNLRKVHHARDNLSKVITQVEFFAKVPERVLLLRERMDATPSSLKDVFLEAVRLDALRGALMREIAVTRNRRMSTAGPPGARIGSPEARGMGSADVEDKIKKMRAAVTNHLSIVPELMEEVQGRVFSNITRMFEMAQEFPANLVMSFEIVEMWQEYNGRRKGTGKTRGPEQVDLYAIVDDILRGGLEEKVEGEFELAAATQMNQEEDGKVTKLMAFLEAANRVLQRIALFVDEVVPCIPPHFGPMLVFLDVFDSILLPRVERFMRSVGDLQVAEILELINWIEDHKECMKAFGHPDRQCLSQLGNAEAELMQEYKDRIKNQVFEWFSNIKKQDLEINKTTNGMLISPNPEDMFNIIHAQLEVAREKLPLEYSKEVAVCCLQVLQQVQREDNDRLDNWRNLEAEVMCVMVNDNHRMRQKCEEFGQHLVSFVELDASQEGVVSAIVATVSEEYIRIATKAVSSLARCILAELEEPIYSRLFSPEWEGGENVSQVFVVTLADYFADLGGWLTASYYRLFLREILALSADRYIMILRRRSTGAFCFARELNAANRVMNDRSILQEFFETQLMQAMLAAPDEAEEKRAEEELAREKKEVRHLIEVKFDSMLHLACVISASQTHAVEKDLRALFVHWGKDGLKLALAALQANPSLGKVEKAANLEAAKKMFQSGGNKGAAYSSKGREEYEMFDSGSSIDEATHSQKGKARGFGGLFRKKG